MYTEMPDTVINVINTNHVATAVNRRSQVEQKTYQECLENLVVALSEQVDILEERLIGEKITITRVDNSKDEVMYKLVDLIEFIKKEFEYTAEIKFINNGDEFVIIQILKYQFIFNYSLRISLKDIKLCPEEYMENRLVKFSQDAKLAFEEKYPDQVKKVSLDE